MIVTILSITLSYISILTYTLNANVCMFQPLYQKSLRIHAICGHVERTLSAQTRMVWLDVLAFLRTLAILMEVAAGQSAS